MTEEMRPAAQVWAWAKDAMYREAYRILGSRADAEDAVMDAMERIVKNERKFSGLGCNDAVALAVIYVRNTAVDLYRDNQKRPVPAGALAEEEQLSEAAEQIVEANDEAERMLALIRTMPPSYRDALLLRVRFDYTPAEIAAVLNIGNGTVRTRLSRAKTWLKKHMENRKENPE